MNLNHHTRAIVESGRGALFRQAEGAVMRRRIEATEARLST